MLRHMKRRICLLLAAFLLLVPISAMADSLNSSPQIILLNDNKLAPNDVKAEFPYLAEAIDNGFVKLAKADTIPPELLKQYNSEFAGVLKMVPTDTISLAKALNSEFGTAKAFASTGEGAYENLARKENTVYAQIDTHTKDDNLPKSPAEQLQELSRRERDNFIERRGNIVAGDGFLRSSLGMEFLTQVDTLNIERIDNADAKLGISVHDLAISLATAEALHDTNLRLAVAEGLFEGLNVEDSTESTTDEIPQ